MIDIEIDLVTSVIDVEVELIGVTVGGGSGGSVTVVNSDSSYSQTGASPLLLPNEVYNIYVNGVLNQSFSKPALKNETININA